MGITKPVNMTKARIRIAAGTMACDIVRDAEASDRKIPDMTRTVKKDVNRKKKNAPGSRLRFVMKSSNVSQGPSLYMEVKSPT
jgi:hypothetical protein